MEKKNLKIFFLILIVFTMVFITTNVYADQKLSDPISKGNVRVPTAPGAEKTGNEILGAVQVIGIIASVGTLMYIGIRYMLSSVEERANMKKTIPYYIIGVVFVGGIVGIMGFMEKFANIIK